MESGGDLLSRTVTSQVPSALKSLTSVFGMGTGGTSSSLPPEMVSYLISRTLTTAQPSKIQVCDHLVRGARDGNSVRGARAILFVLPLLISRSFAKSSPRPISIIKLHTLPYFHR